MVRDAACRATRKDGQRCGSVIVLPSGYCPLHDPERQGAAAEARRKGGTGRATRNRLDRLVPATLRPMIASLLEALDQVHAGELDPRSASAMAALAGAITRAYSVGILEDRVAALEGQQEGVPAA